MGLCSLACCSSISSLLWWSDCMNICSSGSVSMIVCTQFCVHAGLCVRMSVNTQLCVYAGLCAHSSVCMLVCVHTVLCVCRSVHSYVCVYTALCVDRSVCTQVCAFACLCAHSPVYAGLRLRRSECKQVCMYTIQLQFKPNSNNGQFRRCASPFLSLHRDWVVNVMGAKCLYKEMCRGKLHGLFYPSSPIKLQTNPVCSFCWQ